MPAGLAEWSRPFEVPRLARRTGRRAGRVACRVDAQQRPPVARNVHRGVRVRSRLPPDRADDLIEELVATEPKPSALTVVSNDSRVREAGRRAECLLATCEEFIDWLISPEKQGADVPDSPETDKPEPTAGDVNDLLPIFSKPKPKRP